MTDSTSTLNEAIDGLGATAMRIAEERNELLKALKEARCWISDGTGWSPARKGAKCDTANEAIRMIERAIANADKRV